MKNKRPCCATMKMPLLCALLAFGFSSLSLAANTTQRPYTEAANKYYVLLATGKFDIIEKDANDARTTNATLEDGQPALAGIYAGVGGCSTSACPSSPGDSEWKDRLSQLKVWAQKDPKSVTAQVALAMYPLEFAWVVRGNGFSNTVEAAAWPRFEDGVEQSRVALLALSESAKTDPGWYTALLRVARAQGWPLNEFDRVYDEAVARFPRYLPLYFEKASYLAPRWYGSIESFRSYVEKVTKDTDAFLGATLYARLNWLMSSNEMFQDGQADWARMRAGFERMVKDYPHPWNASNFAKYSCIVGDAASFMAMDTFMKSEPMLAAFAGKQSAYDYCKARASQKTKTP